MNLDFQLFSSLVLECPLISHTGEGQLMESPGWSQTFESGQTCDLCVSYGV